MRTARPPRNSTSRPRMIEPPMHERLGRAHDALACAAGSGVVKTSSDGRFGMWTMPSTVSKRAAMNGDVGSSPTVRSVPGPSKCSASKRRSVSRSPASTSVGARAARRRPGRSSSRRQTCDDLLARAAPAPPRRRGRGARARPRQASGRDRCVQLVVRSLTTLPVSLSERQLVAPGARGVDVVEQARARPGRSARSARSAGRPSASIRSPYQGGTKSSVSAIGVQQPLALDVQVEVA